MQCRPLVARARADEMVSISRRVFDLEKQLTGTGLTIWHGTRELYNQMHASESASVFNVHLA